MPVSISMSRFTSQTDVCLMASETGRFCRSWTAWMFLRTRGQRQRNLGIAKALVHLQARRLPRLYGSWVDAIAQPGIEGLPLKAVRHGFYGFGLEWLNFEPKFHG